MNPIQKEAVLNSVVVQLNSAVEIVNCTDRFPELKRSPRLAEWRVLASEVVLIEAPDCEKFPATMFPFEASESLQFCMPFIPQDLDSGVFRPIAGGLQKKKLCSGLEFCRTILIQKHQDGSKNEGKVPRIVPLESA
jgi:hypothetical protein